MEWDSSQIWILPIIGAAIIIFCILSIFLPYGERLKGKIQKIKGFGIDLEVSVLTLLLLIGVSFSSIGVYLRTHDYKQQLQSAREEARAAEIALERARIMKIIVRVTLDSIAAGTKPDYTKLRSRYSTARNSDWKEAEVKGGVGPLDFQVILKDISPHTFIRRLEVYNTGPPEKKWVHENFKPFEPYYILKEQ